MAVKANQRTLYREIELAFSALAYLELGRRVWELRNDFQSRVKPRSHGNATLGTHPETQRLSQLAGGCPVLRHTCRCVQHRNGAISQEVHYDITSLSPEKVSLSQLAQL